MLLSCSKKSACVSCSSGAQRRRRSWLGGVRKWRAMKPGTCDWDGNWVYASICFALMPCFGWTKGTKWPFGAGTVGASGPHMLAYPLLCACVRLR